MVWHRCLRLKGKVRGVLVGLHPQVNHYWLWNPWHNI